MGQFRASPSCVQHWSTSAAVFRLQQSEGAETAPAGSSSSLEPPRCSGGGCCGGDNRRHRYLQQCDTPSVVRGLPRRPGDGRREHLRPLSYPFSAAAICHLQRRRLRGGAAARRSLRRQRGRRRGSGQDHRSLVRIESLTPPVARWRDPASWTATLPSSLLPAAVAATAGAAMFAPSVSTAVERVSCFSCSRNRSQLPSPGQLAERFQPPPPRSPAVAAAAAASVSPPAMGWPQSTVWRSARPLQRPLRPCRQICSRPCGAWGGVAAKRRLPPTAGCRRWWAALRAHRPAETARRIGAAGRGGCGGGGGVSGGGSGRQRCWPVAGLAETFAKVLLRCTAAAAPRGGAPLGTPPSPAVAGR